MAWRAFPISCPKTGETGEFLFPPFRWTGDGWLIDEPYGTQSVDRLPINAINLNISSSSIPDTRSSLKIPFSMFFFSYPKVRTVLSKRASSLILFNVRSKTSKVRRLSMSAPARNNWKHFFSDVFFPTPLVLDAEPCKWNEAISRSWEFPYWKSSPVSHPHRLVWAGSVEPPSSYHEPQKNRARSPCFFFFHLPTNFDELYWWFFSVRLRRWTQPTFGSIEFEERFLSLIQFCWWETCVRGIIFNFDFYGVILNFLL